VTLPPEVRTALGVAEGDEIVFEETAPGVWSVRGMKLIPADQAWFWTPEWQAGEREASEQIARGDYQTFDNLDDFFASLDG
jgi:bifunctional DNA-binding transcriptional regulator/antitoxin component of YhaV-PrlF toxin-antitoxin module